MSLYLISILTNITLISFIALSAYLVLIVGEVSFGQQAFFGVGAYVMAVCNAIFDLNIVLSFFICAASGTLIAFVLSILTLRLSGLYFAIASLSFAELFRLSMLQIRFEVITENGSVGPDGAEGFGNIRWIFDSGIDVQDFLLIVASVLFLLVFLIIFLEKGSILKNARLVGKDVILAQSIGIRPYVYRVAIISASGSVAAVGGGFFALFNTYIEPSMFGVMLGVHSLAYSIIGGLGTPVGPLLGVLIDIGLLESIRFLSEFRMIIFGGLVALILWVFPEGLLSPRFIVFIRRKINGKSNF